MKSFSHSHDYVLLDKKLHQNEKRTLWVVILTATMMLVEVVAGYLTGSMALLADGWHMASHAAALGIAVFTYRLAKSSRLQDLFSFGPGKLIPLGGYTSSVVLAMIALLMAYESVLRLIHPVSIHFNEAIWVAVVGLVVNIVSAVILKEKHHHHEQNHHHDHDHNMRAAYLHVVADTLTSVFAIFALMVGKFYGILWVDSLMGIVGSIIILKWAYRLLKETSWELLDGHAKIINKKMIMDEFEGQGTKVEDLHLWRIAPNAHACELVISSSQLKGSQFYRKILKEKFSISHVVVEEIT